MLALFLPVVAHPSTVSVCDSGCNYSTIATALTAMGSGAHTITVTSPYSKNEILDITTAGVRTGQELTVQTFDNVSIKQVKARNNYIRVSGFSIYGAGAVSAYDWHVDIQGRGVVIDNVFIHDEYDHPDVGGVQFRKTSSFCTIKNSTLYKLSYTYLRLEGDSNIIDNNVWIGHDDRTTFRGDQDAIDFFGTNHIIRNNFWTNMSEGTNASIHSDLFQTWGGADVPVTDNILFERNIGRNCFNQPFHFSTDGYQVQNITIRNNIFDNVALGAYATAKNVSVVNNLFYRTNTFNTQDAIQVENSLNRVGDNVTIYNNMFIGCGDNNLHGWYEVAPGVAYAADYNYVAKSGSYGPMTGFGEPNGINGGNPLFFNPTLHDFRTATGSPAIDKGKQLSSVPNDLAGVARPQGTRWDIGPYEFLSTQSIPPVQQSQPKTPLILDLK